MGGDKSVLMVSLPGGRSALSSRVKGVHFRTRMLRRAQRAAQSSPPPLKCPLPAGSTELELSGLAVLWASFRVVKNPWSVHGRLGLVTSARV